MPPGTLRVVDFQYGECHMPRFHNINGVKTQFSGDEESARDTEEAAFESGRAAMEARQEITRLESEITPRRLRDSVLTADGKTWLENKEKEIAVQRAKL